MKYPKLELGTIEAVVNKLGGMEGIKTFLRDNIYIVYVIDCDADPYIPDGLEIEEHIKGGKVHWSLNKVGFYLCDEQKKDSIEGNKLRKKLKSQTVMNACVLDYLLANPQLIPARWKMEYVFFWGTIYRYLGSGNLFVRFLFWDGDSWCWNYSNLDNDWGENNPAVVSYK